jgi:predicted dienelactone hydrolase
LAACSSESGDPGLDGDQESADGDGDNETDITEDGDVSVDGDLDEELELDSDGDIDSELEEEADSEGEQEEQIPEELLPFAPAGPDAAPDPMALGPYPVGVLTITFIDESRVNSKTGLPRRMKTEIWYPAVQAARDMETWTYSITQEAEGEDLGDYADIVESTELPTLETIAVRDVEMDRSHGPYPVLFFSHGSNGIRFQSTFYTPHLASHGYIVISPDHEGNTLWDIVRDGWDELSVMASAPKRLEDIPYLLDQMIAKAQNPEDFFYGMLDLDNIGISGHSFGGFTSVGAACLDERIKVAVPHSPLIGLVEIFGCDMATYPAPIMVMGGTADKTLEWHDQYCDTFTLGAQEKWLYELETGGHFTFSDMCTLDLLKLAEELNFGDAANALDDGCSETDNVLYTDAHKSINYYATAFLNYHLRGSVGSLDYLVPKEGYPFEPVNFYSGDLIPDWPDGTCVREK